MPKQRAGALEGTIEFGGGAKTSIPLELKFSLRGKEGFGGEEMDFQSSSSENSGSIKTQGNGNYRGKKAPRPIFEGEI